MELVVAITDEAGSGADRLRDAGINIVTIPLGRLRANANPAWMFRFGRDFRSNLATLRNLITTLNIDVVIVSGLVNPHAAIAAAGCDVPVVWQIIDTRTPTLLTPFFMRLARRYASSFMFWGEGLIPTHVRYCRLAQPVEVFGPPVDADTFLDAHERGRDLRDSLNIPLTDPVIGALANINPQKGIEYFGRAALQIYKHYPNAWFVVAGTIYPHFEEYARNIRSEMRQGGIPSDRIIFPGGVRNVSAWLGAFDVKLITSVPRSEGIPTSAVEAMAAGVPVVSTDVGAVREAVVDGETGRVVPPRDSVAIGDAVCEILHDKVLAAAMSAAGRSRAKERFSIEACAAAHRRAVDAALEYRRALGSH